MFVTFHLLLIAEAQWIKYYSSLACPDVQFNTQLETFKVNMLLQFPCTLKMQESDYLQILVYTNQTTWLHIPGIYNLVIP